MSASWSASADPFQPPAGAYGKTHRMMGRTGLIVALAIGAVTAVAFTIRPDLDLRIASLFYRPGEGFVLDRSVAMNGVRDAATIFVGLLVARPIWAVIVKLACPSRRMPVPGRTAVFLAGTLLLAPLVTANLVFKEHWGRPRPNQLTAFGGSIDQFRPWWDPRGPCASNCSFVGGETAAAFWTIAPAALAPPQWRPLAYAAALTFGVSVSIARVGAGGHFFSDVAFSAVITFVIVWLVYAWLFRWRRPGDEAVERAIGRAGMALRRPFGGAKPAIAGRDAPPRGASRPGDDKHR